MEVDVPGCKGTADLCDCGRSVSVLFVSCNEAVRGFRGGGGSVAVTIGPCVPIILCTHIDPVWQVGLTH